MINWFVFNIGKRGENFKKWGGWHLRGIHLSRPHCRQEKNTFDLFEAAPEVVSSVCCQTGSSARSGSIGKDSESSDIW
jgi:hypothetical protein